MRVKYSGTIVGPVDCYGSCEGLAGTLNKLANRGNGRTAQAKSPSHFNFMTMEA